MRLVFEDLSERFDPTSVQLQAFVEGEPVLAFEVLEQSFEYNLLDKHTLPQRYLGRELLLERRVWANGVRSTRRERAVLAQLEGANMIFKTDDGFEAGIPEALFRTDFMWHYAPAYDVTAAGQRFLVNRVERNTEPISLVTNWTAALPDG